VLASNLLSQTTVLARIGFALILCTGLQATAKPDGKNENKDKKHYHNKMIQFWGDVYLPAHVLRRTKTSLGNPHIFHNLQGLLESAKSNVINFEGAATRANMPVLAPFKRFLLKMPLWVPELLASQNIHVATLGNNHALDFGYAGLFDSKAALEAAGVAVTGAGRNLAEALHPAILATPEGNICILSFNRTFPREFWASDTEPGTAFIDYNATKQWIKKIKPSCFLLFTVYHWGQESTRTLRDYQRQLARLSIDAGADAVIGHHPHIAQKIELYQNKPIVYSTGNAWFGTNPFNSSPDGLAVAFDWDKAGRLVKMRVVGLKVDNSTVKFFATAVTDKTQDFVARLFQGSLQQKCRWHQGQAAWTCHL